MLLKCKEILFRFVICYYGVIKKDGKYVGKDIYI